MGQKDKLQYGETHPTLKRVMKFMNGLSEEVLDQYENYLKELRANLDREAELLLSPLKHWRANNRITEMEFAMLGWHLRLYVTAKQIGKRKGEKKNDGEKNNEKKLPEKNGGPDGDSGSATPVEGKTVTTTTATTRRGKRRSAKKSGARGS